MSPLQLNIASVPARFSIRWSGRTAASFSQFERTFTIVIDGVPGLRHGEPIHTFRIRFAQQIASRISVDDEPFRRRGNE